ncbi:murein hydrolase activator EnvC family protein [Texcoconibacillus texcoconensis]|uniref:Peptidoglycan hydrolase CwlO-like protein n=1 Tax=Texcoconibacillus texcoconensis TaxID=1095777 RepID=A0A840QQ35_9BACI|nr:M23 family metallopeptidase [Texcoconibacillus texcoconensis]MBB5173427.1 peptidoglycan hydrolase CwlO-like protein [Texcoconibacillus texcoconensis]
MKQKWGASAIAFVLGVLLVFQPWSEVSVSANTGSDLEDKIRSIQEEREEKQREAGKTEEEMEELHDEIAEVEAEMAEIDAEVAKTNQQIREKEGDIAETEDNVTSLEEEIVELEERIEERDDLLKDRVRSMYQNGGEVNYIEVLLGAQSFGDLLDRIAALTTIAQQDRNILDQHIADKQAVEEAKQQLEEELASLEEQLEDLETLKANLDKQRDEKDVLMDQLEEKEVELSNEIISLEEADEILQAQEEARKQELERWEEQQRQQQTQQTTETSSGGDGTLQRPATGAITSGHGPRWGSFHHGIDIGQGGRSNVPIVAAEAGTVIRSYYSASYGNAIFISHNVGGQELTTVYAHLQNREVSSGERVERGQRLGYMGNTGRSTGPHLHFEVHEGPWNLGKTNAVDPLRYIE